MAIARYTAAKEVPTDQPWSETFRFWRDTARTRPLPIQSATAWLKVKTSGAVVLTIEGDYVVIQDNTVELRADASQLAPIAAGVYELELQAVDTDGRHRQLRGPVKIVP